MQPWLQPMQVVIARPSRAFEASAGSVIIARVMPTASHTPSAISRSASAGSRIRPVAITGTELAARIRCANPSITFRTVGEGGTMKTDPR